MNTRLKRENRGVLIIFILIIILFFSNIFGASGQPYSYTRVIAISFFIESPCSDEYEGTKIQIRELGGKWFRRINGGLIYCDKDNQEPH